MSLDATRWAWMQECRKATDKLVLLSMADRADENHMCFPSISRISADTQLNRKTVMEAIKRLQEAGLIDAAKNNGASNIYRLVGVQDRTVTSPKNGTAKHSNTSPKNGTCTEIGTSPKNGTQPVPKTGLDQSQKRDTNLSITNQEPTKDKKGARFIKPSLNEITTYCTERQNNISPQAFFDHYESNGWRVGRNPMRDWKAAVRTWEKNQRQFEPTKIKIQSRRTNFSEIDYEEEALQAGFKLGV